MQSNKTTNTNVPVESTGLTDEAWLQVRNEVTKRAFDDIYRAAKQKNREALAEVRSKFLGSSDLQAPYYTTAFWNGETPMSLLAFEGDEEAVNFLKQETGGTSHSILRQEKFGIAKRTTNLGDFSEVIHFDYPLLDLIVDASLNTPDEPFVLINENSSYKKEHFSAFVYAAMGYTAKVNEILMDLKGKTSAEFLSEVTRRIAYFYASYGHHNDVELLWAQGASDVRKSIIEGYLEGGYVNQLNKLFNSFSYLSPADWSAYFRLKYTSQLGNYNHSMILLPLLAGINAPEMRGVIFDRIFYYSDDKPGRELTKAHILNIAANINQAINEYHLSFQQALIFIEQSSRNTIALVKTGKMSADEFEATLVAVPGFQLTKEEALDLFNKVRFVGVKTDLINDLNQYEAPRYNSQRHHVAREISFKAACLKTESFEGLGSLIAKELGLFAGTEQGDAKSAYKHEQPLRNKTQDEFPAILKKYQVSRF